MQIKTFGPLLTTTPHFQSVLGCNCNGQNKGWSITGILTLKEEIEIQH